MDALSSTESSLFEGFRLDPRAGVLLRRDERGVFAPVTIGSREIAIFNLGPSTEGGAGERFLATDNECPHQGGPLCDGIVTGESVVCPLHAWKVNLANGCVERPAQGKEHCVSTYPTRVDDGIVVIGVPVAETKGAAA